MKPNSLITTQNISPIRPFEGKMPQIGARPWIDPSAVLIGDIILGDDVSIWPGVMMRGDVNQIVIGDRTNIQDGTLIHVTNPGANPPHGYPTMVGSDVTIGHGAMLHGCTIEEGVLIGMRVILLDGSHVEKHSILGAGALLAPGKVVKTGELWVGAPARRVRFLSDQEIEQLYHSAKQYASLKDRYLREAWANS